MIWLIGNKGMLGAELGEALTEARMGFVGTDREVDVLDPDALRKFAKDKGITWIVNCAAYTAVEKAEDEVDLCTRLNVDGPENIARIAKSIGAKFLHISTDYVFDGSGTRPYYEDDPVAPIGVYGRTKAEGEAALRGACPEHVILRTAWLYGLHGANFVYTMLRLMGTKDKIGVVYDQRGTPTWAADLSSAIISILKVPAPRFGTYHFTNAGETNWHEFACEIQRLGCEAGILSKSCPIEALTTAQYPTKVRRPAYSVLSKEKIKRDYGIVIPDWKGSLRLFIKEIADRPDDADVLRFLPR